MLDSAIAYAEEGFPLPLGIARSFASNAAKLAQFPSTASVLLRTGVPPREGDQLANPDLARSLRTVAAGGAEAFYRGPLTRTMVQGLRAGGGLVFTVEALGDTSAATGYRLNPHGRYSHAEAYVRESLVGAGFTHVELLRVYLRTEGGKPVEGWLVSAQAPRAEPSPAVRERAAVQGA